MAKPRKPRVPAAERRPDGGTGRHVVIAQESQFHGPIPHPEHLARYDAIVPGAAERILCMAEDDAAHQQHMERAALEAAARHVARGQHYGLGIGLAGLIASVVMALFGHEWSASIIGGSTVVGLVAAFVVGRIPQGNSRTRNARGIE